MANAISTLNYYARCGFRLARYGKRSEYVMRYGYARTISDIYNIEIRSHWLNPTF